MKKQNPAADSTRYGREIDVMVYHFYGLTYEEARVIDPALNLDEFDRYRI